MATPAPEASTLPTAGERPAAPPGMVAVPAAALSGAQQHAAQQAGTNIGMMGGAMAGSGGADMANGAVLGGYIGQQIGRYERTAAMHDPNAPMVLVDENSRAGRRAVRRQKRREGREGGNWLKRVFGFGGSKKSGEEERAVAVDDGEGEDTEPVTQAKA